MKMYNDNIIRKRYWYLFSLNSTFEKYINKIVSDGIRAKKNNWDSMRQFSWITRFILFLVILVVYYIIYMLIYN